MLALFVCLALAPAHDARAQIAGPITCNAAAAGKLIYNADHNLPQYCNGTDWVPAMTQTFTIGSSPCPAGEEGKIIYNADHNVPQFCNGTNWIAMASGLPKTGSSPCPPGEEGKIIYNVDDAVMQFCDGTDWVAIGPFVPPSDTIPDAFSLTDQTDVAISTQITSNSVTITGIDASTPVSVTGDGSPELRINGGTWVTSGNITNGQSLEVRLTSNAANSTMNSATVDVGGVTDQWDVTTIALPPPTGCPNIGDVCSDGSVFAGDLNMYITDANQTNGIRWATADGTGDTGADSTTDGAANQAWIVANTTLADLPAFELCANLNQHGRMDWYVPAQDELNHLYTHRAAIGAFTTDWYWSSTEMDGGSAWRQRFSTGAQQGSNKRLYRDVRCVRRQASGTGDTTPDAFAFTDQTDVAVSTQITSNSVTITGIDASTPVSVTGDGSPELRINGGSWVTSGTIDSGQTLEVRLTSNAAFSSMNSATVDVGGVTDQWDVTTEANDPCASSPSPGDVCADGSIFAGDTNMYVTDVNQGTIHAWSWNNFDNIDADSLTNGAANQAWVVANEPLIDYPAFEVCHNLNRHGHTDWYLPARNELNHLRVHRAAIGGFIMSWYWSSSEFNRRHSWLQNFDTGQQLQAEKIGSWHVRCTRRD